MARPQREKRVGDDHVPEDAWLDARRVARVLERVFDSDADRRTAIATAATELRVSTRQVYNLLGRYGEERRVRALLPRTGGTRRKRLRPEVERIVATTLRERWLVPEGPPLQQAVDEIRARCDEQGFAPPAYLTVRDRMLSLFTDEEIAHKRGEGAARYRRLKARSGSGRARHTLGVMQIDHTPTDIAFVEVVDGGGTFVGRAYLTLLTDSASSAVAGFCLSLEKPSTLTAALCLAQAICPKEAWLAARDIAHPWPMWGRPRQLLVDGGAEFEGKAFEHGCADFGIRIRRRNRGTVHHGAIVERLLGKLNGVLGTLPGRTGRSIADRGDYRSEDRACLTFDQLERCVTLAILDHNQNQNARTLRVPEREWAERADGRERVPDDPHAVLLNFLPRERRALSPQGIGLFALDYFDPWLAPLVAQRDRLGKLDVRYDPRDVSHVYVRHPGTGELEPVGRRDGETAPITLWQHRAERARERALGARQPSRKVALRREIAEIADGARTAKRARRDAARTRLADAADKPYAATGALAQPAPHPAGRAKRTFPVEDW